MYHNKTTDELDDSLTTDNKKLKDVSKQFYDIETKILKKKHQKHYIASLPPKHRAKRWYEGKIRRYRSWWYRRYRRRYERGRNSVNHSIHVTNLSLNATNAWLKSPNNEKIDTSQRTQKKDMMAKTSDDIADTMDKQITLQKQQEYYNDRVTACKEMHDIIKDENIVLKTYCTELSELKEKLKKDTSTLQKDCSTQQIINDDNQSLLTEKNTHSAISKQYIEECDGYKWECAKGNNDKLTPFTYAKQLHKTEDVNRVDLDNKHKICINPKENVCKDILMNHNVQQNDSNISANIVVSKFVPNNSVDNEIAAFTNFAWTENTATLMEGMTNSDYIDILQGDIDNKRNYSKLKLKANELNNFNNNYTDKNGIGTQNKLKYDKTIMINILLTAVASSILYCTFMEI
jgi:hypothetical protein